MGVKITQKRPTEKAIFPAFVQSIEATEGQIAATYRYI